MSSIPLSRLEEKKDDNQGKDASDPPYKIFGIEKHTPSKIYYIWGKKFSFNYAISSLTALSFLFGWLDSDAYSKFGFMCTMQTANIVFLADNIFPRHNEYYQIATNVPILIVNLLVGAIGGCFLSLYLLETTQNRKITFGILITMLCAMCFVVDIVTYYKMPDPDPTSNYNLLVVLLSVPGCGLFHCSSKLGYLLNLMTGNIMKVADAMYRRLRGYPQGGATLRGDIMTLTLIILAYFAGCVCVSLVRSSFDKHHPFALIPLGCTWPFQLWLGDVLPEIGINFSLWNYVEQITAYRWSLQAEDEGKLLERLKSKDIGDIENGIKVPTVQSEKIIRNEPFSVQELSQRHLDAIKEIDGNSKWVQTGFNGYNVVEDALYTLNSRFHHR